MLEVVERSVRAIGGIAALSVLALAVIRMLQAVRLPAARQEPATQWFLRPAGLLAATAAFVGAGIVLWRPLPLEVGFTLRVVLLVAGASLHFGGLTLYLLGMRSLGNMFAPSSGFGARLQAPRRLVTDGAFRLVRHPMYLGVILTSLGVLMLYRTWASLALAVMMFGLTVRARREDRLLASEFGDEWTEYAARVPGWIPGFRRESGGI